MKIAPIRERHVAVRCKVSANVQMYLTVFDKQIDQDCHPECNEGSRRSVQDSSLSLRMTKESIK